MQDSEKSKEELIEEINALRKRVSNLEARYQSGNEILSVMTHVMTFDIQNSLGLIGSFSDVLEQIYTVLSDEERSRYLHLIAQRAYKANYIVDALLLLHALQSQRQVTTERLDMVGVVDEVQERLTRLIEKHQAKIIAPEIWPIALGNAAMIAEVWYIYLRNLILQAEHSPRIELGFGHSTAPQTPAEARPEQPESMIRFWACDRHNPLTLSKQREMFEKYDRLELIIIRHIMEKLNGAIETDKVLSFLLPRAEIEEEEKEVQRGSQT
ncbi:MAG: hypothetical protein ACLFTI_01620 [Anaerolineales bacterium]